MTIKETYLGGKMDLHTIVNGTPLADLFQWFQNAQTEYLLDIRESGFIVVNTPDKSRGVLFKKLDDSGKKWTVLETDSNDPDPAYLMDKNNTNRITFEDLTQTVKRFMSPKA